jgi:ABC-type sugar transport system ATPase subunit
MTVKENIAFGLKMRKFKDDVINKKVQEKELQLNEFLESEKKALQEKVDKYYSELESMKHLSFDEFSFDDKSNRKSNRKTVEKPEPKSETNENIVENGEEKKE